MICRPSGHHQLSRVTLADLAEWRTDEWLRKRREAQQKATRPKRGGGSAGRKKSGSSTADRPDEYQRSVTDILADTEALRNQADAIAKVTAAGGDWEQALAVNEEEQQLLNAAQKAGVDLSPEVRASIRGMAEDYVSAEQALDDMREATERGEDAFRDLFGSFLDGADAAKEALAKLLMEIARVQFAKSALGILGGTSWGASLIKTVGGLTSYDGGGYTGDGARMGGLDGKGGYLAMVHPQETITDHTKGQQASGGAVTAELID